MKTLDLLENGQSAVVKAVHGENTSLRRRLLDMGITKGTEVSLVRTAPLGDPIELNLRGYSLTIRKSDAHLVEVL
ncbi:MAG: ferrous iron transport protein A [Proteobacteria bacterium]|uniref:Ferrous iron transport protein A n=1 Tax=Candidatus Avisuccinivibrio stercorigallinarum TaxID=2840704 RepID=A0A9D9DAB9_9GAMM|nr:ferrous iron transport protein A [Candidatus Avisuccinivibrio stercorigallinarum]